MSSLDQKAPSFTANRILAALVILLVALNLRPALTSVGPILIEIKEGLPGLGAHVVWLSFLPVLAMGIAGYLAPKFAARFGAERAILGALVIMILSMALRAIPEMLPLFAGTILAGLGIGVTGVLLPSLVKRDFRDHSELMMGLFTMALCLGAAIAAGLSKPVEEWLQHWSWALAFWAIPALLAAIVWWPMLYTERAKTSAAFKPIRLWGNGLAWSVTIFMGLQSSLAYAIFAWAAPILRERSVDPVIAGAVISVSILAQIPISILLPFIAKYVPARVTVLAMVGCSVLGILGLMYWPLGGMWFWAVILGIGQGGSFAIALTLLVQRSQSATVAASLSSMSQGVGYTMAATCPLLVGFLRESFGDWLLACVLMMVIAAFAALFGLISAQPKKIFDDGLTR